MNQYEFTQESVENRLACGKLTTDELRQRAYEYWSVNVSSCPARCGEKCGCPVCLSELAPVNRLFVSPNGYVACDYCVNYVEGYIRGPN